MARSEPASSSVPPAPVLPWHGLAVVAVVTIAVYAQVLGFDFVNFDDPYYVHLNPHVRAGPSLDGVVWAFTRSHSSNWHPLTWLSHMLDFALYADGAGGHHATSVALHVANTLLVYGVLAGMTGARWRSLTVAAFFALHPTRVESVAWISERKDVLSTFFWLLTIGAYARWVRARTPRRYLLVALALALGLMAKPMLVSLPVILLVLDWWPLGRLDSQQGLWKSARGVASLVAEKLPLLVLAAATAVIAVQAQLGGGAVVTLDELPLSSRLANAVVSVARYPAMMLWPIGLAPFYPLHPPSAVQVTASLGFVGLTSAVAARLAGTRPYVLAGWLWYLVSLLPVAGVVQVGLQSHADRYTYVPFIGLFVAITWGLADLASRFRDSVRPRWVAGLAVAALAACTWLTWQQVARWRDSETLFAHALAVTEGNFLAHASVAAALSARGAEEEAYRHYLAAVRLRPTNVLSQIGLGNSLRRSGQLREAEARYREALRLAPALAPAHSALGILLGEAGDHEGALRHHRAAVDNAPEDPNTWANLGNELRQHGEPADAARALAAALRLRPDWNDVRIALGASLLERGDTTTATAHLRRAVELDGGNTDARFQLGTALLAGGSAAVAVAELEAARRLDPTRADVAHHLGIALALAGDREAALDSFSAALALRPSYTEVRFNRARTLIELSRHADAEADLRAILAEHPGDEHAAELLRTLPAPPR